MKDILSILLFIFCLFPSPLFGAVMKEIVLPIILIYLSTVRQVPK